MPLAVRLNARLGLPAGSSVPGARDERARPRACGRRVRGARSKGDEVADRSREALRTCARLEAALGNKALNT
jgi:hypothetical protein